MLRKSLIMMALAAAFTMNVSAVQIKVPEGQPPMPGADASIPANAYEDYRHINKVAEQEVESYIQFVESKSVNPASKLDKLYRERSGFVKASELADYSQSTVVLLHEWDKNIRLSVPNVSLRGDVVESPSGKQGSLFAVRSLSAFLVVGPPHAKELNKYSESKGKYMYPGLRNTSWKLMSNNAHVMYTEFTPNDTNTSYGITYGGWVNTEDPYQDKAPEVVMSNYIIPSIESLSRLDTYSHVKHWDNFSYRIPKKAKLVIEAMEDNKYEVRTYEASGIKIRVLRFQIDPNVVDKSLAKKQIFAFLNKYGDLEAPTQYATVWNNGLPGFLIDRYKHNGESFLRHFTKDSEYYYSYRIDYDESKSSYKHKQLRDMVEYVDFDNVESLRKAPQWRISNSHKKKLDADPIFNPWYMEWIKILTQ